MVSGGVVARGAAVVVDAGAVVVLPVVVEVTPLVVGGTDEADGVARRAALTVSSCVVFSRARSASADVAPTNATSAAIAMTNVRPRCTQHHRHLLPFLKRTAEW